MTITASHMLARATALAGAACAATGKPEYKADDLSLSMNIAETRGGTIVSWSVYLGNITTDGNHGSAEEALDELEAKLNRLQGGSG